MGCKTKDLGGICSLNGLQCHAGKNVLCYEEEPQATKQPDLLRSDDTPCSATKRLNKEGFERAILAYGVSKACEYFNHLPDGGFFSNLKGILDDKYK